MKLTDAVDLSRDEWNNLIDQYIFVDEHRKILKRRLLDGLTYNQLAEEFNFSVPHIKSLTLPTAKAGGFLLQPSLPTIDRSYTMSTSVGITPSFRVPHGTYV